MSDSVLLVGGTSSRLETLKNSLKEVGWKVHALQNPKEALEALRTNTYEAVFCDEELKGASVPGLLSFTRRLNADLPFYVFGEISDKVRLSYKMSGEPNAFLPYPPLPIHLPAPKGTPSIEEKTASVKTPLSGNTSLVALSTVLEMMGMAGQTGTVELEFGKIGLIYVDKGLILHAVLFKDGQTQQGLPALSRLLNLENTEFRLAPYDAPKRPSINLPASSALTEAARISDELDRFQIFIDKTRKACPSITAIAIGYPLNATPIQGYGDIVTLFQKAKTIIEKNRDTLGKLGQFFGLSEQGAFAFVTFGEGGNIIVAAAPPNAKDALYKAVKEAVALELA
jgi:CheY-like chemotaxis protein